METASAAVAGSNLWIVAVNLVIWTGLFFLLLRLDTRLRAVERETQAETASRPSSLEVK
jgi:CcmD family protein